MIPKLKTEYQLKIDDYDYRLSLGSILLEFMVEYLKLYKTTQNKEYYEITQEIAKQRIYLIQGDKILLPE